MMQTKKSSVRNALKALYVLPLMALSLTMSARTTYNYEASEDKVTAADTLKGKAVKVYSTKEHLENTEIYIDGVKADKETLNTLPKDNIKSMNVVKPEKEGGKAYIYVYTTEQAGSSTTVTTTSKKGKKVTTVVKASDIDADVYVDGKKVKKEKLDKMSSDKIQSITVDKSGEGKAQIKVDTKKKK